MQNLSEVEKWLAGTKNDWWKSVVPHKEHEPFQIELDSLSEQIARRIIEERSKETLLGNLTRLRQFLTLKEVLAIAKRIGERLKPAPQKP